MLSRVDLPLPEGPSRTTNSPEDFQIEFAQGQYLDLAHAIGLRQAARDEYGLMAVPALFETSLKAYATKACFTTSNGSFREPADMAIR